MRQSGEQYNDWQNYGESCSQAEAVT